MKKRRMIAVLALSLLLGLEGCGSKSDVAGSNEASTAAASTVEVSTTEVSTTEVSTTEASTIETSTVEVTTVGDNTEVTTQVNLSEVDPVDEDVPVEGTPGAGDAGEKNESGIRRITCVKDAMFWKNTRYSVAFSEQTTAERMMTGRVHFGDTETIDEKTAVQLNAETAAKIEALYEKYQMWRWDGFDMFIQVTDGVTMNLTIEFNDGKKLNVKGYMVYPRGFKEFYAELEGILQPLFDKETTSV